MITMNYYNLSQVSVQYDQQATPPYTHQQAQITKPIFKIMTLSVITWLVNHVMHPSLTLLDTKVSPLGLRHKMGFGNTLGKLFG